MAVKLDFCLYDPRIKYKSSAVMQRLYKTPASTTLLEGHDGTRERAEILHNVVWAGDLKL